jgi:hypothetical protein
MTVGRDDDDVAGGDQAAGVGVVVDLIGGEFQLLAFELAFDVAREPIVLRPDLLGARLAGKGESLECLCACRIRSSREYEDCQCASTEALTR